MLITKSQQYRFFREWSKIKSARDWTHDQAEAERHALLIRCGFNSLTEVDHIHGFTAVLKQLAILQENITGMVRADANGRRMMIYNIRTKSPTDSFWRTIAQDRFGNDDLDLLSDQQLEQLLYTICDRQVGQHRNSTKSARKTASQARPEPTESRIKFPKSDLRDAASADASLVSEEEFQDQVHFQPTPEAELVSGPF